MTEHRPERGDAMEAWIKGQRDRFPGSHHWVAINDLLDEYRLAADTGQIFVEPPL